MTDRGIRERLADERGATLALVAMMLTAMLTLTALVVDIGLARGVRQQLVPAADAAALAAAQDLVHSPGNTTSACNTAASYVAANAPESTVVDCAVDLHPGGGRVVVTAAEGVSGIFAELGEDNDRAVGGTAGAAWGAPTTVSGLRPLGLCYDGNAALQAAIDNPPAAPTHVFIPFVKDDPADCGGSGSVGNLLSVDFGHETGIYELKDWARDGYPGQVSFGPTVEPECEDHIDCVERPYAIPAINSALWTLVASGDYVPFPVYDFADDDEVHLIGFVRARLLDFSFDPYQPLSSWWLEIKVQPGLVTGTCCGTAGFAAGNQVVALCAVDPDDQSACEPDTGSGSGGA